MKTLQEVSVALQNASGREVGNLQLSLLPDAKVGIAPAPLLDLSQEPDRDGSIPPFQLLEGWEYRFELRNLAVAGPLTTDRPEVFQPDTKEGRTGRVRPGSYTGTLPVAFRASGLEIGRVLLEVRSRKLNYLSEYRWMLRDIAEQMTEIVMDRFAVAQQSFSVDNTRDAVTLYERFAFLRSLITSDDFRAGLSQILSRPHVAWVDIHEAVSPAKGPRADSYSIRQLSLPGKRMPWPGGRLATLPITIDQRRTQASTDTTPNRFVKYALETWRSTLNDIERALQASPPTATTERGAREVEQVLNEVDSLLASELFRELGNLRRFPAEDQVLQKRAGYRDVYRAYIQFEVAAKLSWTGGEDVYGAGQRDVATLYEYWAFLVLAQLVSSILEIPFDFRALIEPSQYGLNVSLKTGRKCVLSGSARRSGRLLSIELWFNRTFSAKSREDGAWTRDMRPDYSIIVKPGAGETASFEPVVLHFDAKYRVTALNEILGSDSDEPESTFEAERSEPAKGTVLRTDLLKMHAYRDAIRRSVGAYVLYPGDRNEQLKEYHEILPGLGAFALRPSASGDAQGTAPLKRFLEHVLEHVALQITQHERGRYWLQEVYSASPALEVPVPVARFINTPPADTLVLLGFVRDQAHWNWIKSRKLYNLRAYTGRGQVDLGSKELGCDLIVLSCRPLDQVALARVSANPEVHTIESMQELGYPEPHGPYFCLPLEFISDERWERLLSTQAIERVRRTLGATRGMPVVISWQNLATQLIRTI